MSARPSLSFSPKSSVLPAKPKLRYDKVALRFVSSLQTALCDDVPTGKTLLVTITAPIRVPAKTAAALQEQLRTQLARGPVQLTFRNVIHGNHVRARLVDRGAKQTSNVLGFVHNPDTDGDVILKNYDDFAV
jgi:hypothetical protein